LASAIDTGFSNTGACVGRTSTALATGVGVGDGDGALQATASNRANGSKACIGEVG
jgi:hypothetical protein